MNELQTLLQISAKVYTKLGEIPNDEERDEYIEQVSSLIEERDSVSKKLLQSGFSYDATISSHKTLFELDKGIRERLENLMNVIKQDMKTLQVAKKNEQQYTNPYSHVQTMDGMYYDKKK